MFRFLPLAFALACATPTEPEPFGCEPPLVAFSCAARDTAGQLTVQVQGCALPDELPMLQAMCLRQP